MVNLLCRQIAERQRAWELESATKIPRDSRMTKNGLTRLSMSTSTPDGNHGTGL
jgi:hypothetical protein